MLLSKALELNNRFSKYRLEMRDLARLKGIDDPEVMEMREKLEQDMDTLQKLITYKAPSEDLEDSPYLIAWGPWKGGEEDSQGM